jgi:hypothetical protein
MNSSSEISAFLRPCKAKSKAKKADLRLECVLIEKFIEFIEKIIYRIYRKIAVDKFDKFDKRNRYFFVVVFFFLRTH